MIELISARTNSEDLGRRLLATVSSLALLGFVFRANYVHAADTDTRPTVWVELGGQLERIDGGEERFAPSFLAGIAQLGFVSPAEAERPARFSNGIEGKVSFEPAGSNWVFSAAALYGRAQSSKHLHSETAGLTNVYAFGGLAQRTQLAHAVDFADTVAVNEESHLVLDFQVGKDVGLGIVGPAGHSTFLAGIRFAQFTSQSHSQIDSDQNVKFRSGFPQATGIKYFRSQYDNYKASSVAQRSVTAIGPSMSWDASAMIAGGDTEANITFDWGAKAAVLFGRQKARTHLETASAYRSAPALVTNAIAHNISQTQRTADHKRARTVLVPNIDAFAGLSFRYTAVKVSLGYRGDFFFGAMDGGLESTKRENRNFYGPFATVSIGLGG